MALSRVKTWNAAETLTAADLNSEFNQISNHFGSIDNDDLNSTASYVMGELVIGSGITSADGGQLHVFTATAGSVQAHADADEAVFENSGAAGMTILSGATSTGTIAFGDAADNDNGLIKYTHGATPTLALTVGGSAVQSIAAAATTFSHPITVGQDDQGYDVKFFGDTASAYLLWDTSADKLLTAGGAVIDIVKDKLLIGGTAVTTTAAELNVLDAVTAGTVAVSKAVVVDSNKDIASFRNVTLTGELDAATLDISGNADIDGTLETDALSIASTTITSTAAEINLIDGGTARGTDAVASGDGILINDAGTMKMTNVDTVSTYFASHSVGGTNVATVGTIGTGTWQGTAIGLAYGGTGLVGATDGKIVIADGSGAPVLLDVGSSTAITTLGTVTTGTWQSSTAVIASAYLDADTAHLSTTQTFSGDKTFTGTVTVGVDDTGKDVKFFGATSGSSLLWDESADDLIFTNAGIAVGSDATGDIYYRDASGFLERLAASTDGYVLTATGAGSIPAWEALPSSGTSLSGSTNNTVATVTGANALIGEANLTFTGSALTVTGTATVTSTITAGGVVDVTDGSAGAPAICNTGDTNTGILFPAADTIAAATGGSERLRISSYGEVLANETVNTNMTVPGEMTLNQGDHTGPIMSYKSSDVVHTMTAYAETDTYAQIRISDGDLGGASWQIFAEDGALAHVAQLTSYGGTASATKSTAGPGLVYTSVTETDGNNGLAAVTANGNIWAIRSYIGTSPWWTTQFIIDEDGDYHYNGADGGAFDEYDDVQMVRAFTLEASDPAKIIRTKFDEMVHYNKDALVEAGVIGYCSPEEEAQGHKGLVNGAQLQRLHTGAIWQLHTKQVTIEEELRTEIDGLRNEMLRLKEQN